VEPIHFLAHFLFKEGVMAKKYHQNFYEVAEVCKIAEAMAGFLRFSDKKLAGELISNLWLIQQMDPEILPCIDGFVKEVLLKAAAKKLGVVDEVDLFDDALEDSEDEQKGGDK